MTSALTTARIKPTLAAAQLVWRARPHQFGDHPHSRKEIGQSADRMTTVELAGPPDGLHAVTLLAGVPRDTPRVAERNGMIMAILLAVTVPEWDERDQWLATSLRQMRTQKRVAMQGNGKRIVLRWLPKLSCTSLTIECVQPDAVAPADARPT